MERSEEIKVFPRIDSNLFEYRADLSEIDNIDEPFQRQSLRPAATR